MAGRTAGYVFPAYGAGRGAGGRKFGAAAVKRRAGPNGAPPVAERNSAPRRGRATAGFAAGLGRARRRATRRYFESDEPILSSISLSFISGSS